MTSKDIDRLSEEGAKDALHELIEFLDEMDQDDTFGTEGWKSRIGWE